MTKITEVIIESKKETKIYFAKQCQKKITKIEKEKLRRKKCYCPHCKKEENYVKRGSRERRLKTSEGEIRFQVKQIQCKKCKKIQRPIIGWLNLKARQQITEDLLEKASQVAINTSYKTAKRITKTFTGSEISANSIRKKILEKAKKIKEEQSQAPPEDYKVIMKDSTKGKTGKTKRGEDINIAFGAKGRSYIKNRKTGELSRPGIIGQILNVTVGDDKTFAGIQHKTENVMTDGDRSIKNKAKAIKNSEKIIFHRCNWHLPRMFGYALYHDGLITKPERSKYVFLLHSIIKYSFKNYEKYYQELKELCKKHKLKRALKYLQNAEQEFYNTKKNPIKLGDKYLLSNSPIERVMREVDRRADIGCRWSKKGLEAITIVRLNHIYNNKVLPDNSIEIY